MSDLLEQAVEAHGGLDRWNEITSITAHASITGAIWHVKGRTDVLCDVDVQVETRVERLTMDFRDTDKRTVFTPGRVDVERRDGTSVDGRDDPEGSFAGQELTTPWDDIHVAYFSGEALWTYLTTPFLLTRPDVATEEVAPITTDGETWRRLRATFPDTIATHTREQFFCFGPDGLLRRHDYTVDLLGGGTGLNYASDYRDVGGIAVPAMRRVYAYEGDYQVVPEPLLVAVDLSELSVS